MAIRAIMPDITDTMIAAKIATIDDIIAIAGTMGDTITMAIGTSRGANGTTITMIGALVIMAGMTDDMVIGAATTGIKTSVGITGAAASMIVAGITGSFA